MSMIQQMQRTIGGRTYDLHSAGYQRGVAAPAAARLRRETGCYARTVYIGQAHGYGIYVAPSPASARKEAAERDAWLDRAGEIRERTGCDWEEAYAAA